jgi:hypothetical protein
VKPTAHTATPKCDIPTATPAAGYIKLECHNIAPGNAAAVDQLGPQNLPAKDNCPTTLLPPAVATTTATPNAVAATTAADAVAADDRPSLLPQQPPLLPPQPPLLPLRCIGLLPHALHLQAKLLWVPCRHCCRRSRHCAALAGYRMRSTCRLSFSGFLASGRPSLMRSSAGLREKVRFTHAPKRTAGTKGENRA